MRRLLPLLVIALAATALAADPNSPHPHRGKLKPYSNPPPHVSLTLEELGSLDKGQAVRKTTKTGDAAGYGVAVQDINAPTNIVWAKILDFSHYPEYVSEVSECEPYATVGDQLFVRFVLSKFTYDLEYFIRHTSRPDQGYITWTLDYDRKSELDDTVGYWLVSALPTTPPTTRVEYSVQLRVGEVSYVPDAVVSKIEAYAMDSGLVSATAWVKERSESAAIQAKRQAP